MSTVIDKQHVLPRRLTQLFTGQQLAIANNMNTKMHFMTRLLIPLLFGIQVAVAQQMLMGKVKAPVSRNIYMTMMDSMMVKMMNAAKGSSAETEFLNQMIPHHEGAIAMANYEIEHGKDFSMIQLAKSILAEQQAEVQQMKIWVSLQPTTDREIPPSYDAAMNRTMSIMMQALPEQSMPSDTDQSMPSDKDQSTPSDTDRSFAWVMIPHHQAAIDMGKVLLRYSRDGIITSYCEHLISSEQMEIEQMLSFIKSGKNEK
jgi:uncharacterized protein (DUF305 family)